MHAIVESFIHESIYKISENCEKKVGISKCNSNRIRSMDFSC